MVYDIIDTFFNRRNFLGSVKSDKYLRFFPGGWMGVRTRIGDYIRKELKNYSRDEVINISRIFKIHPDSLFRIMKRDYSMIDSNLVDSLPMIFIYDLDELTKAPVIPQNDQAWILEMKVRRVSLGGTNISDKGSNNSETEHLEELVNLYVTLAAVKEL